MTRAFRSGFRAAAALSRSQMLSEDYGFDPEPCFADAPVTNGPSGEALSATRPYQPMPGRFVSIHASQEVHFVR